MRYVERAFNLRRGQAVNIYPIGDAHIGKTNCNEKSLKRFVEKIRKDPNGYWFGGGDLIDAIKPQDAKRFDPATLPDWLLTGSTDDIRARMSNIINAEVNRLVAILSPIAHKCLGLISGNHEDAVRKHHNHDAHQEIIDALKYEAPGNKWIEDLTDCAYLRLAMRRFKAGRIVSMFISHGYGGGRSAGAEPTRLDRIASDKDVDILFVGHSHSFYIAPAKTVVGITSKGELAPEVRLKRSANWGCWLLVAKEGAATYDSRALFPYRPECRVSASIVPFSTRDVREADMNINMREEWL